MTRFGLGGYYIPNGYIDVFCVPEKFLKRTSIQSNGLTPLGKDMLESQSNTVSLLQPSVPQVPLFLHPRGCSPAVVEQLLQPIFLILIWYLLKQDYQKRFILRLQEVKIALFVQLRLGELRPQQRHLEHERY